MRIPLIAKTVVDKNQHQKVEIWRNGRPIWVDAPFRPYFYSTYELYNLNNLNKLAPQQQVWNEKMDKILISNLENANLYKYSFLNTKLVSQYREMDSVESDILFTDRIAIDAEDFYLRYPNTDKLKILFFDIECDTIGMFPIPQHNAIIGIGAKCGDKKGIFLSETYNDDRYILNRFFDFIREIDPDIIAHYNGNQFDIPYMLQRMKFNHISENLWSRNNHTPHFFKNTMAIGGRISFDIYNEVERDQTIFGIKNHKMKTVARWLSADKLIDIKEVPYTEMRSIVNTNTLKNYLKSDILITEFLFNIYFKNILMLAEMNKLPLNMMVDAAPSFLSTIIHGREFKRLNMVANKNNAQRYPQYIKNKKGALCDTFAPGFYNHKIFKYDYSSQYPRIVQTFNISPEVVKLIRYDTYTGEYSFDISNPAKYIFRIPDDRANKDIIVEIDMTKRGFLARFMDEVLSERFLIKKKMKSLEKGSTEYEGLHVRQNALKVIANVQTGYQGQEFARFGSLACYHMITGMGRFYIQLAMDFIKQFATVISIDTDGIYANKLVDLVKLNEYLDIKTKEIFNLTNYLHMDSDDYDGGFFRATKGKHYCLKDGNKIIFHGQSFKGSHMPAFFDKCLEQVARDMFDGKIGRNVDITKFPIESLIQSIKVKDENDYKTDSSLSMQLINAAKREMPDIKLNESDQLSYIKTDEGYELIMPDKKYGNIDYKYYQSILDKIYERLQIEDNKQVHF